MGAGSYSFFLKTHRAFAAEGAKGPFSPGGFLRKRLSLSFKPALGREDTAHSLPAERRKLLKGLPAS